MKKQKVARWIVWVAAAAVLAAYLFFTNRVVATTEGNRIFYDGTVYEEVYDVLTFDRGRCLGRVDFAAYNSKIKIYALKEMPDHILLDMGLGHRIYRAVRE